MLSLDVGWVPDARLGYACCSPWAIICRRISEESAWERAKGDAEAELQRRGRVESVVGKHKRPPEHPTPMHMHMRREVKLKETKGSSYQGLMILLLRIELVSACG